MLYNEDTVATLAARTRPKGIVMIVSRKITATALLGVVMASAAALAKLRPASQMMATTTAAVPAAEVDSKRPKGLGDVIAENPTVKRYFGLDDD